MTLETEKSKVKVLEDLVTADSLFPSSWTAVFSVSSDGYRSLWGLLYKEATLMT